MRSTHRENSIEASEVRFSAQEWVGVVGTQFLLSAAALAILGGTYVSLNRSPRAAAARSAVSPLLALARSAEASLADAAPTQRVEGTRQITRQGGKTQSSHL